MIEIPFNATVLKTCTQLFLSHPVYADADHAITMIIEAIPAHDQLPGVLAKVAIIKTLYATTLYDTGRMAKHILSITAIDDMLASGNRNVVDRIRRGHGIVSRRTSKEMDFYSFATKYCSFHNKKAYPVFDNLVADFVRTMIDDIGDLRDYEVFTGAIDRLRRQYGMGTETYKDIDMGLWIFSKYRQSLLHAPANAAERAFLMDVGAQLLRHVQSDSS